MQGTIGAWIYIFEKNVSHWQVFLEVSDKEAIFSSHIMAGTSDSLHFGVAMEIMYALWRRYQLRGIPTYPIFESVVINILIHPNRDSVQDTTMAR